MTLRVVRQPKRRSLTAAAAAVTDPQQVFRNTMTGVAARDDWQNEAWDMLAVGELRYYVSWRASACSRCRLVASDTDPQTGLPTGSTENARWLQIVKMIAGGPLGQAQLLKRAAQCLTVPGEVWVAIITDKTQPAGIPAELLTKKNERWLALSKDEIHRGARGTELDLPEGGRHEYNESTDSLIRVWNPNPRKASEADSPVRSTLDSLHEIVRTTKTISNASKSRLIGNGVVFVPQEMSLPPVNIPGAAGQPGISTMLEGAPAVQQLQELLWQVANTAYDDEDSMAALIPMFATVPGDQIKNVNHLQFDNQVTDVALKTRNDAISRLAMGLDVNPERLLGLGSTSNHWCADEATEALTQRGWLRHDQIAVGDEILTLNHDTGLAEWNPVLDLYRANVADEPMRLMQTQRHNSLTTMNHRWPVLRAHWDRGVTLWEPEWATTNDLGTPHKIITATRCADVPTEPKYTDDFVELVGWHWTEGSQGAAGQVSIAQSHIVNNDRVMRIRSLLTRLYGPAGPGAWGEHVQRNTSSHGGPVTVFRLHRAPAAELLAVVPGRDKIVPTWWIRQLTAAQLRLFVEVSCLGDGWHLRHGVTDVWAKNPAALDAFELALVLSGVAVSRHASGGGEAVRALKATTQRPGKGVTGHRERVIERYTGVVWCPTTDNGTWFARRNGQAFYTGNSAWQLADDDVQLHIVPVLETICAAINEKILAPILAREGLDPAKYVLWYDASHLTADPDNTNNATAAFAAGAITAEAYRDYLGLDADAGYDYTTLEGWQVWAQDHLSAHPELLPTLAPLLGPIADTIPELMPAPPPAIEAAPPPAPPANGPPQTETQPPPVTPSPQARTRSEVQSAIVDLMVGRALELAGKRRRTRTDHARLRGIPMHETHRYMPPIPADDVGKLIDGWDAALEEDVLRRLGVDSDDLRAAVRSAVRAELTRPMVDA